MHPEDQEQQEKKAAPLIMGLTVILCIALTWAVYGFLSVFFDIDSWSKWLRFGGFLVLFFVSMGLVIGPVHRWLGIRDEDEPPELASPDPPRRIMPESTRVRLIVTCAGVVVMILVAKYTSGWWQIFGIVGAVLGALRIAATLGLLAFIEKRIQDREGR